MVTVVAHGENAALRHRQRIRERLPVTGKVLICRLEGIALVQRRTVHIDRAGVKVDIDRLAAGGNDAFDDQLVILGERRRIQDDHVALLHVAVQEIALQHQIVAVDQRRIHGAAVHADQPEKENENKCNDRQQPHEIVQTEIGFIALRLLLFLRCLLRQLVLLFFLIH